MTYTHAATMALRCKAHDAALDAGNPSPFTADQMAMALAWLDRSGDPEIDAAMAEARAYTEHATLPDMFGLQWVNDAPPPAIGAPIVATINACGPAIVTGYFTQEGYLGILCDLITPPDWHAKQNKGSKRGHLFGPEFQHATTPHDIATPYGQACFASDWLAARERAAGEALAMVPGVGTGNMGLTPDTVKASPEYQRAKARHDAAFARLRAFNATFTKAFKRELAADRASKRAARTKAA